jgi:hypothetical protein
MLHAVEERAPDPADRIMKAMRRSTRAASDIVDARRPLVEGFHQLTVFLAQFFHAARQSIAAFKKVLMLERLLRFNEHQAQLIAEVKSIASTGPDEIQDLVPRNPAGPVHKTSRGIELIELVPEDQAHLLEQVVGVVKIPHQRINVAEQLGLMGPKTHRKFGSPVIGRLSRAAQVFLLRDRNR